MGNGNSFTEQFKAQREVLVSALEERGRDPETFPISKHVHLDSGEPRTAGAGLSTPNVYLYPRLKADTAHRSPEMTGRHIAYQKLGIWCGILVGSVRLISVKVPSGKSKILLALGFQRHD